MSTHVLDASGQRGVSLTINEPSRTGASVPAKAGDDVAVTVGGAREVRLVLPPGARIERREYVTKTMRRPLVKDEETNEYLYDERTYEHLVLVMAGSLTAFGRTSKLEPDDDVMVMTPHTTISARRWTEPHFTESGKLLKEYPIDFVTLGEIEERDGSE